MQNGQRCAHEYDPEGLVLGNGSGIAPYRLCGHQIDLRFHARQRHFRVLKIRDIWHFCLMKYQKDQKERSLVLVHFMLELIN